MKKIDYKRLFILGGRTIVLPLLLVLAQLALQMLVMAVEIHDLLA